MGLVSDNCLEPRTAAAVEIDMSWRAPALLLLLVATSFIGLRWAPRTPPLESPEASAEPVLTGPPDEAVVTQAPVGVPSDMQTIDEIEGWSQEIQLRVLDADGVPLRGAYLLPGKLAPHEPPKTDADGCVLFSCGEDPPTDQDLKVCPEGWDLFSEKTPFFASRSIPGGLELTVDVVVTEGAISDQFGQPVARAYLALRHDPSGATGHVTADEQGCFSFAAERDGRVDIEFRRSFGERQWLSLEYEECAAKGIPAGKRCVSLRTRRFERGGSLTVRVAGPQGEDVPDVMFHRWVERASFRRHSVQKSGGTFTFEDLFVGPFRPSFSVPQAWCDERGWIVPEAEPVLADGRSVEIRLVQGVVLRGVCRGPDGAAVAGAEVFLAGALEPTRTSDPSGAFTYALAADLDALLVISATAVQADGTKIASKLRRVKSNDGAVNLLLLPEFAR